MAIEKYLKLFDKTAQKAIKDGERIFIEKDVLNPLTGLELCSIAFYKYNGKTIGIIYWIKSMLLWMLKNK